MLYCDKPKIKIKLNRKQKWWIVVAFMFIMVILIMLYLNYVVNPVILFMSEAKVRSLTQKAVNAAVYEIINREPVYDNLITITINSEGDPVSINADAVGINQLARELVMLSQTNLEEIGEQGIDIPIGSFSGMPIFVGRAPNINIRLLPIGVITCNFLSEFSSAGINQTNHKIYVNVNSKVSIVLPTMNQTVTTTSQLLIAENIIIGNVPETFLSSVSLDEMLNLVPDQ